MHHPGTRAGHQGRNQRNAPQPGGWWRGFVHGNVRRRGGLDRGSLWNRFRQRLRGSDAAGGTAADFAHALQEVERGLVASGGASAEFGDFTVLRFERHAQRFGLFGG